jgi:hypothetical protein
MKTFNMKITGIVIMLAGFTITIFTAIDYLMRENVLGVGSDQLPAISRPYLFYWTPFLGIAVMVIGTYLIVKDKRNRRRLVR